MFVPELDVPVSDIADIHDPRLRVDVEDDLVVHWTPLLHAERSARVVILDVPPSVEQADAALQAAKDAIANGADKAEVQRAALRTVLPRGTRSRMLARMLDACGLNAALDLPSCEALWTDPGRTDLAYLSAFPFLMFGGECSRAPRHASDTRLFDRFFPRMVADLRRIKALRAGNALIVPLGFDATVLCEELLEEEVLDPERVLRDLPYPSGAYADVVAHYCDLDVPDEVREDHAGLVRLWRFGRGAD